MGGKEARNIIEQDLKEKLLGPGYAKDVIACSDDCLDEIIPDSPRNAYRIGIIAPELSVTSVEQEIDESYDDLTPERDFEVNDESASLYDTDMAKIVSDKVDEPDDSEQLSNQSNNPMTTHIGLITCLSSIEEKVDIEVSYGTYEALSWKQHVEEVKVKTGKFTDSIKSAIEFFDKDEKTINSLKETSLSSLNDIVIVDSENKTISLSPKMIDKEVPKINLPKSPKFIVEAELIKVLFSKCFKRAHHAHSIVGLGCDKPNLEFSFEGDDNVRVYINSYEINDKVFLSVILKSISSRYIYQPTVCVKGNFISYTEPISSIEDDSENAMNEFLYRDVNNYGKGINCAINWDDDSKRIFTTFTPTVDVEKFTNVRRIVSEVPDVEEVIIKACTLRNLSIWSNKNIVDALDAFVNSYESWHETQRNDATAINEFVDEKQTILAKQEVLKNRLRANVDYLRKNCSALQCFKIANTAMLMQMVVARHPLFEKNRDTAVYEKEPPIYDDFGFFERGEYVGTFNNREFFEPSYYPFQLAFLLMNVKSTFELSDPDRKLVDLIWFPTGGGKTEAYLALSALTIVARRHRGQDKGVSVIMRYTLRLLTTQQFERATYLICALEFLRKKNENLNLGNNPISIGLYVGSGVTPNRINDYKNGDYKRFNKNGFNRRNDNPFPVTYCPWCGSRIVRPNQQHGYQKNGSIFCMNNRCHFKAENGGLPLIYIDETIYSQPPTLLFATVDKFAQLYSGTHAKLLRPDNLDTPDLIIQDELHLLVGALGSIVGFYESIIEKLCSKGELFPKIIAATATTRNTSELIKKLYNREASVFPPHGLDYSDNYFSYVDKNDSKRRHLGLISAECVSSNMTEIRLTALLILSKVKIFKKYIEDKGLNWQDTHDVIKACRKDERLIKELDDYWTTVLYFNSLKDLGRSRSRVSQEIFESVRSHQFLYSIPESLSFLRADRGFYQRVIEFTSRVDSNRIKHMLTQAGTPVKLEVNNDMLRVSHDSVDLVFASNMISVGIDIARWNLLVMVGQPRSTSEYIQSSSRAARSAYGLVVNLMNPRRIREHSLFENYVPFHRTFYKGVEPLSITPMTSATIKHKVLVNLVKIYKDSFMSNDTDVERIAKTIITDLFANRYGLKRGQFVEELLYEIQKCVEIVVDGNLSLHDAAQSLREIASDSYISISGVRY